jgi:hypothetical protein
MNNKTKNTKNENVTLALQNESVSTLTQNETKGLSFYEEVKKAMKRKLNLVKISLLILQCRQAMIPLSLTAF